MGLPSMHSAGGVRALMATPLQIDKDIDKE